MLRDNPFIVRVNISRPSQSVPKGWKREGERFLESKLVAILSSFKRKLKAIISAKNIEDIMIIIRVFCLLFNFSNEFMRFFSPVFIDRKLMFFLPPLFLGQPLCI